MTVQELIDELKRFEPNDEVGLYVKGVVQPFMGAAFTTSMDAEIIRVCPNNDARIRVIISGLS
jgi:hypothetical protein